VLSSAYRTPLLDTQCRAIAVGLTSVLGRFERYNRFFWLAHKTLCFALARFLDEICQLGRWQSPTSPLVTECDRLKADGKNA